MTLTEEQRVRFRARIMASVTVDHLGGCWLWQKTKSRNGYGTFAYGAGKNARAHRVSYAVFKGDIPDGLDVCHSCDVRACVNPEHLFWGTRSENILDASRKNRVSRTHQKKGSQHPAAKLTEPDIAVILARLDAGEFKTKIARDYDVSDRVILLIARGESWKHVQRGKA